MVARAAGGNAGVITLTPQASQGDGQGRFCGCGKRMQLCACQSARRRCIVAQSKCTHGTATEEVLGAYPPPKTRCSGVWRCALNPSALQGGAPGGAGRGIGWGVHQLLHWLSETAPAFAQALPRLHILHTHTRRC